MSITLNTKTYNWAGWLSAGIAMYREVSGGIANAFSILTGRVDVTEKSAKVSWKLKLPYVASEDSSCACTGEPVGDPDTVDIVIRMSKMRTAAQRADLALRVKDLAASTEFQSSISSLTQPSS